MELKVIYDGKLDVELETKLDAVLAQHGWKRWASGFDLTTHQRDIAYDKDGDTRPGSSTG